MSEIKKAIAYFEDGIRETDEIIAGCSPDLQAELTEQKRHFEVALYVLTAIRKRPELTSPVKYYTDGKPYLQIGGFEMTDNPIVEACARLDRDEKYIIPHLQAQLAESQRRERAAVEDLELVCTVGESCFVCKNLENRGDDFPCIYGEWCMGEKWQWRGPEAGEE